jgi:zinc protease
MPAAPKPTRLRRVPFVNPSRRRRCAGLLFALAAICSCGTSTGAKPPTVIVVDSTVDYIYVRLLFVAGSAYDPPGKEGLAYLTASALRGSPSPLPSGEIEVIVDRDVAVIDGHCPAAAWPTFSQALISILTRPLFDSLDIRRLIEVQLEALDSLRADDLRLAQAALQYYLYRDHPYGHPPEGFERTIRVLTMADAREFWRQHYTSGNYILGLAGNVPSSAADDIHAALRAALNGGKPRSRTLPVPSPVGLSAYVIEKSGCDRSTVLVGRPIRAVRGDSAFLPLELAVTHLAGQEASKGGLDQLLRRDRGLVSEVFGTVEHNKLSLADSPLDEFLPRRQGYLLTGTRTQLVNTAFVLNIIMRELDDLSQHGVGQIDLDGARAYAIRHHGWAAQPAYEQMRTRLRDLWLGVEGVSEKFGDDATLVTGADVRRAVADPLNVRTLTAVAIVPDGQAFATQLLSGQITYEYPPDIDRRQIHADDQRFLSYRPPWELQRMRIVKAAEMFRH